jgi:hypothetical protein
VPTVEEARKADCVRAGPLVNFGKRSSEHVEGLWDRIMLPEQRLSADDADVDVFVVRVQSPSVAKKIKCGFWIFVPMFLHERTERVQSVATGCFAIRLDPSRREILGQATLIQFGNATER